MDLNQLYFSHQLDLLKAASGAAGLQRSRHLASADRTALIIARLQQGLGAPGTPLTLHGMAGVKA